MSAQVIHRITSIVLGINPGVLIFDLDETLWRTPVDAIPPRLYESTLPAWVAQAQYAGWKAIGCTARQSSSASYTRLQLETVGIRFDRVLFTDGGLKGATVRDLCDHMEPWTPVVIFDDDVDQVASYVRAFSDVPLRVRVFHFQPL